MLLVINKGRSTHTIKITSFEVRNVVVGFFHENDVEAVDNALVFFPVARPEMGGCVHLSQWDVVYILHDDLCNSKPLSNLQWFKGGSDFIRHKASL